MPATGTPAAQGLMPDLRGMCAREATRALAQLGLVGQLLGDGVVVEQGLPPGGAVRTGATCVLRLDRRPPAAPPGGTP
jgi:beta-lactam-binding protein with PASTA domain